MKLFTQIILICFALDLYSCQNLSIDERVEINEKEDWLFIGGDVERTNISKSKVNLEPPYKLYWQYDVDGGLSKNCLAVSDAILFVNTLNGEFFAIDITSGKSLGRTSTIGRSSFSTPLILGNNVIIASSGDSRSKVFNYNLVTGIVKWEKKIGWVESSPLPDGDNIIFCAVDGIVYNLNSKTGRFNWTTRYADKKKRYGSFYTSPAIAGNLILAGNSDYNMYAFDLNTGKEIWNYQTGNSINCDAAVSEGKIYFGSDDMSFYCIDTTGNLIWKKELNTKILSSPTFYDSTVIISAINGKIYSLNKYTGDSVWAYTTKGVITASPLIQNNKVYVGSYDTYFYCLNASDGRELWKYQCEGRIKTSAVIWKNFIFTASDRKFVYCFSDKEMPEEEFKPKHR